MEVKPEPKAAQYAEPKAPDAPKMDAKLDLMANVKTEVETQFKTEARDDADDGIDQAQHCTAGESADVESGFHPTVVRVSRCLRQLARNPSMVRALFSQNASCAEM